jgi:hypothetical protein
LSTYVKSDAASPWGIKVTKLVQPGYPLETLCYKCYNMAGGKKIQTITKTFQYRQRIDCMIALDKETFHPVT